MPIACWQAAVMQMVLSAKIGLDAVSHGYTMGNYLGFPRIRHGGSITGGAGMLRASEG